MSSENFEDFNDICFTFKLVNGDSIVCHVLRDTEKNIVVRDPIQINTHAILMGGSVRAVTYYTNWFTGSDMRVHLIRKDHIISAAVPDEVLVSEYNEALDRQFNDQKKPSPVPSKNQWNDLNFKIDPKNRFGPN